MKLVKTVAEMTHIAKSSRCEGSLTGFVPTMGYLHEGHLALVKEAKKSCDKVVASIFVNPTQFSPGEDYERYPRDIPRDTELLESQGVDILFSPEVAGVYPEGYRTYVEVSEYQDLLCGITRRGHFRGVTTIVAKLFNIVMPHKAFFGEKDAQQLIIIQKMVKDLNMDIEIIPVPTVREADGLAMSSRNTYLTPEERAVAPILYRTLTGAKEMILAGEREAGKIKALMRGEIEREPSFSVEYISICDRNTLEEQENIAGRILVALAARLGRTRLIDNIWIDL